MFSKGLELLNQSAIELLGTAPPPPLPFPLSISFPFIPPPPIAARTAHGEWPLLPRVASHSP